MAALGYLVNTAVSGDRLMRYCGRDFTEQEIRWIRRCAAESVNRSQHAKRVCEHLGWRKPDGGFKQMSAKVALLRMHRDGVIELPAVTARVPRKPADLQNIVETDEPPQRLLPPSELDQVRPLQWEIICAGPNSRIWNSFIERYHYLGYKPLPGAQMRYLIRSSAGEPLALMGFGACAWKTAPRDLFIGWDADTRQKNLSLVVNNARFLILPWVRIPNLASHLLAQCEKRLPGDWQQRYAITPVLLETFCEKPRFAGICYRAANWTLVGETQGRGKMDRFKEHALPIKDVWLRPLQKNWREILNV